MGEAAAMALLASLHASLVIAWRSTTITIVAAFLMGCQNTIVTRLTDSRVRATYVSGICTDLGIELSTLWTTPLGSAAATAERGSRLELYAMTILFFILGGLIGTRAYRWLDIEGLLAIAAVLFLVSVGGLLQSG